MKRLDGDEMKLVSGLCASGCALERPGRRNGIGAENRVSGRQGTTLAVGFNPAYELNELNELT